MQFLDDEEPTKAQLADDIVQLNNMWRTEAHSPEILPYMQELVDDVTEALINQQVSY
jgi:hypothetical protein